MFVVLIQTSGKQPYIFGTNKLRENVGASQLTYESGAKFVLQAIDALPDRRAHEPYWDTIVSKRRRRLLDPRINPPMELTLGDGFPVEIIYAASGSAFVLTNTRDTVFS